MSIEAVLNKLYHQTTREKIEWEPHGPFFITKFKKWNLILSEDSLYINNYRIIHSEVTPIYQWLMGQTIGEEPEWIQEFLEDIIRA